MDCFEKLDPIDEDTSCCLILECLRRNHEVFYLQVKDLEFRKGKVWAMVQQVMKRKKDTFVLAKRERVNLDDFHVIFMRKDPPFNLDYLYSTYILEKVSPHTLIVNQPRGIRRVNEKLYVLNFPLLAPNSLVSKQPQELKKFLADVGGQMIVKPLNHCSGRGIIYLRQDDINVNSLLEMVTQEGERFVIAQEYLFQVKEGDKRILLLEGNPLGAMCRIPPPHDYRANIHSGAKCIQAKVESRDKEICKCLAPRLVRDGIYFAGIDVIGGKVVEINVTSPAGIPEINRLNKTHLERKVINWIEKNRIKRP